MEGFRRVMSLPASRKHKRDQVQGKSVDLGSGLPRSRRITAEWPLVCNRSETEATPVEQTQSRRSSRSWPS